MLKKEETRESDEELTKQNEEHIEEDAGNDDENAEKTKPTGKGSRAKHSKPAAALTPQQSKRLAGLALLIACDIVQIRKLFKCQIRSKVVDSTTVELYAERLNVSEAPPIILIQDDKGRLYIADGHHRVAAALRAGRTAITAIIYKGTRIDARIVGVELNRGSLPLTPPERKALLEELLDNPELGYSVQELAAMTGLHQNTVEKRKQERDEGDFLSAVSGTRRSKNPEEKLEDGVKSIVRQVEKLGSEALVKALGRLPVNIREDIVNYLNPTNES